MALMADVWGHYVVIRYVPNDVREEFVNVGVIIKPVRPVEGPATLRWTEDFRRAHAITGTGQGDLIRVTRLIDIHQEILEDQLNRQSLEDLVRRYTDVGILRLTPPRATKIDDATLDQLMKDFVETKYV